MRTFLIAVMLVLFSQAAWSEARTMYQTNRLKGGYEVKTVCIDGYKFVVIHEYRQYKIDKAKRPTITQFYEERNGKALPAKC